MRPLMFRDGAGRRLGGLRDGGTEVTDLAAAASAAGVAPPPADLLTPIGGGDEGLARVSALLARPEAAGAVLLLSSVEVLAPLDPPRGNVLAVRRHYAKHAAQAAPGPGRA